MSYSTFPTRDFSLDMRFLRAVEAAIQAQDIPRAVAMARQGLADGLVHPMLLNLRAFSYENEGRNDDALRDLHHAAEIAPDDPTVQNAYGLILARMQKTSQAIAAFERTIRLAPDFPGAFQSRLGEGNDGRPRRRPEKSTRTRFRSSRISPTPGPVLRRLRSPRRLREGDGVGRACALSRSQAEFRAEYAGADRTCARRFRRRRFSACACAFRSRHPSP